MSALDELWKKADATDLECAILWVADDKTKEATQLAEKALAELARYQRIAQAAREYVDSRTDNVRQFPKFQKLAAALQEEP